MSKNVFNLNLIAQEIKVNTSFAYLLGVPKSLLLNFNIELLINGNKYKDKTSDIFIK